MTQPAPDFRYTQWDGSQLRTLPGAEELFESLADDLMEFGDLDLAMRNLLRQGTGSLEGLRDMLQKLRAQKQQRMRDNDLSGVMENLRERLDEVLELERAALDDMLQADQKGEDAENFARNMMGQIAASKAAELDTLPESIAERVQRLSDYEFVSPDAQKRFAELLEELRQAGTQSLLRHMKDSLRSLTQEDVDRIKRMVEALNDLLVQKISGETPDFDAFMAEFGDMFGDPPPQSLDALLEQMQRQMAAMQSLMMSMPTSDFEQLQALMRNQFGDPELDASLRKLMQKLSFLDGSGGQRYPFSGDSPLQLNAALEMMGQLNAMDELESQLRAAQMSGDLSSIDTDALAEWLGEDARDSLEELDQLQEVLERAGYLRQDGKATQLTPRAMRAIGHKALAEVFRSLHGQGLGNHRLSQTGRHGEALEDTKPHEFGDPFNLHMPRTLRNAVQRNGVGTPVRLQAEDFEVFRNETTTRAATVMLVDLSWSMELRGAFPAAKKVALALDQLIRSSYPRDSFHVVGFSAYAKALKPEELTLLGVDEYVLGTNIQHALLLAERLLARERSARRQVLLITDGEPTAHIEHGRAQFAYPPTPATIRETLKAAQRCTRQDITINTFMLDESYYLRAFVEELTRINGGRVFYAAPHNLGEYVLVDFVEHRRKVLGR